MSDHVPPQLKIMKMGLGFTVSQALLLFVKAGIAEQLKDQPKSIEEIATVCDLDGPTLFRFFRFASSIGVVEEKDSLYALTEAARFLLKDQPGSMAPGLALLGTPPWQDSWADLLYSVRTGKPSFDHVHGVPFFQYLKQHPEFGEPYDLWMSRLSEMQTQAIVQAYDFSPYETICDVGGGQGALLHSILSGAPKAQGILFDQPDVVHHHRLGDLSGRVRIMSGDFFVSVPPADLIILKTIIHDWDDEASKRILGKCLKALKPNGRILLGERVIGAKADFVSCFYDLHMLVLLGGRERTEAEFKGLFDAVGLRLTRIIRTNSPLSLVEGEAV